MTEDLYADKSASYFSGVRRDFVSWLPANPDAAVLEVGCSNGRTGAFALDQKKCGRYVGIELMPEAAERARAVLTEVLVGDIETMELPFEAGSFDALILSEVLEHLVDPWSVVRRLRGCLRPGGIVMASSPNVCHHSVVRNLIAGRWELRDRGIMDRTHLRWFTPSSYRALFEDAGFAIDKVVPVSPLSRKAALASRLTFGRIEHLLTMQTAVYGRRSD